jgi:hypothetical protein
MAKRDIGRIELERALTPLGGVVLGRSGVRAQGEVANISSHGLFFSTPLLPKPGAEVCVVFEYPPGNRIEVLGEVRWNRLNGPRVRSGFGMHIEEASDSFYELWQQLAIAARADASRS